MTDMDPIQMQIAMIKAQMEAQKNMYRQMYASDPEMVERCCAQLDQSMEMQIQMLTQMMQGNDGGVVDPMEQARSVMEQLGYDEDMTDGILGTDDGGDSLVEEVMGDLEPSEFGYREIIDVVSSLSRLQEPSPNPADADRMRRFEVLLTGIISVLNDHLLDGLDVEPRDGDSIELVEGLLSGYWGIEDRDDLIGTIRYLVTSGHSRAFMDNLEAISSGGSPSDLYDEDMDEEDRAFTDSRFEFTRAYAGNIGPEYLRGWDLGRAANITRWGYFVNMLTEEEAWSVLDQIAESCTEEFDGWISYAQSYLFGSMFWKCPYGPEACFQNAAGIMFAVEHLLTEGPWKDFPWVEGKADGTGHVCH